MDCWISRAGAEKKMQKIYGVSLVRLGKPSDSHIYDLSEEFLLEKKSTPEGRFLAKVREYFFRLPLFERKILVANLLESGSYYPYWYLPEVTPKEFSARQKSLLFHLICFADDEGVLA